jgi:hypothetical protein
MSGVSGLNVGGLTTFLEIHNASEQDRIRAYSDLKSLEAFSNKNGNPTSVMRVERGRNERYEMRPKWRKIEKD